MCAFSFDMDETAFLWLDAFACSATMLQAQIDRAGKTST
jgi:hypothetical protein